MREARTWSYLLPRLKLGTQPLEQPGQPTTCSRCRHAEVRGNLIGVESGYITKGQQHALVGAEPLQDLLEIDQRNLVGDVRGPAQLQLTRDVNDRMSSLAPSHLAGFVGRHSDEPRPNPTVIAHVRQPLPCDLPGRLDSVTGAVRVAGDHVGDAH